MTTPKTAVQIDWIRDRDDMPAVLDIEQLSFPDHAWTAKDFERHLRQPAVIGLVAHIDRYRVGYMVYELAETEIDILNLAVHPDFRRWGVAKQLVGRARSKLKMVGCKRITAVVRDSNLGAQLFFRSLGFRCIVVDKKFYEASGDDAYVFQWRVPIKEPANA